MVYTVWTAYGGFPGEDAWQKGHFERDSSFGIVYLYDGTRRLKYQMYIEMVH